MLERRNAVWDEERAEVKMEACLKTSRKMKSMSDLNKNRTKKQTEHRKVKSAVMEPEEHNRTDRKVNDEHEEYTSRHEGAGGAEGAMGEKETCGEEEKMERGGNWHEQEVTGEKMSM